MWDSPICSPGTVSGSTGLTQGDSINMALGSSDGGADVPLMLDQPDTTWPSATELVIVSHQEKLIWLVSAY